MAEQRPKPSLILASSSPRRLQLLQQVNIKPDHLIPAGIDEIAKRGELPRELAQRLARKKVQICAQQAKRSERRDGAYILAADTVVARGRLILQKPETVDQAADHLYRLSGRAHRVYSAVCLMTPGNKIVTKVVETRLRMKRLSKLEIETYVASGEWRGKAGGYAIQGLAGAFFVKLIGSYTNVVGLPLFETVNMMVGEGYPVHYAWVGID